MQNRCLSLQTWLGTLILNSFQHFVSNLPFFEYSLPLAEPLGGDFYYFTSEVDEYLLGGVIKDSLLNENNQKGEMAILLGLHSIPGIEPDLVPDFLIPLTTTSVPGHFKLEVQSSSNDNTFCKIMAGHSPA